MEIKKSNELISMNACLDILDGCDVGLSLVWLWTWSTIKNVTADETWVVKATEDELWNGLVEAVEAGKGFSLEYGAEQHYEDVVNWLQEAGFIVDSMFEEEEE